MRQRRKVSFEGERRGIVSEEEKQTRDRRCGLLLLLAFFAASFVVVWRTFLRVVPIATNFGHREHSHLDYPLNSIGDCGWRDPSSLLVLRVPKAGSTSIVNSLGRVSRRTRRFRLKNLPEWTMAVGPIPGLPFPRRDPSLEETRQFRFGVEATVAPDKRRKRAYAGHVFYSKVSGVAVVGLARHPQQRLASGFYYSSRLKKGDMSLEECLSNSSCVARNDLARLCSLHSLYYCGHHPDCGLDPTTRVATDRTVELALGNLNSSSNILLVVPSHRLDEDGLPLLRALLPAYFQDPAQNRNEKDFVPYDREGERRSPDDHPGKDRATGKWRLPPENSQPKNTLDHLCRQDSRVFALIQDLFQHKLDRCSSIVMRL